MGEEPRQPVRPRLVAAAFALFEERGYEQTTVDDIAERAGVGRTTFFRTFRSKEEVIFPDHDEVLAALEARLRTSTRETALVAVAEAARLVLEHYLAEGEVARARYRLIRSVPALRQREMGSARRYLRVFREFVHRWMGGTPETALRAELMAAAVVTAHNHVLRRWLRDLTHHPQAEFDTAMAQVFELFAGGPSAGVGPTEDEGAIVVFRTGRPLDSVLPTLTKVLGPPEPIG